MSSEGISRYEDRPRRPTPGLENVSANDARYLPDIGKAAFLKWRASGLRIDEWIAKEYPDSDLGKGVQRHAGMPTRRPEPALEPIRDGSAVSPDHGMDPGASLDLGPLFEQKTFGLRDPDEWKDGRE